MSKEPELPASLTSLVERVEGPISPGDVDTYGRLQSIRDQSHRVRTIVSVWKKQQDQERAIRGKYAKLLIVAMIAQAAIINIVFVAIGFRVLNYEPWTARAFILAVFGEVSAMVFFVLKYLFRPTADKVLELAEERPPGETHNRGKHVH